jgi:hypothetical protein
VRRQHEAILAAVRTAEAAMRAHMELLQQNIAALL